MTATVMQQKAKKGTFHWRRTKHMISWYYMLLHLVVFVLKVALNLVQKMALRHQKMSVLLFDALQPALLSFISAVFTALT